MRTESTIEFDAELGALQSADQRLEDFSRQMGWTDQALFQVRLVVEELLMNIISHGSDGQRRPSIRLQLAQDGDLLMLEIADDGIAFDPLQAPPPDLEAELEDRPIGGLGVHLVRQLSDTIAYRRVDGWNRLEVTKTLR
jgi:anti-sigma regulatory factor (Ser/Thr protein kinase)